MSLLAESTETVFNTGVIEKGNLICAKHQCWAEPKTGIVSAVSRNVIRVLHHPNIANVTCYYEIAADEVEEGLWEIRWSESLQSINEYIPEGGM